MGTPAPFRRDDDAHPPLDWPDYRSTDRYRFDIRLQGPDETAFFAV
jgi:hypothetical protein